MSISNKDIVVKSYFSTRLFEMIELHCTAANKPKSQFVREAVEAVLIPRVPNHIPAPPKKTSPKSGLAFPGRRGGAPIPIRC